MLPIQEQKKTTTVGPNVITHMCKDCSRTFKDINNYKEHRFQEHQITEFPNIRKCSMCSYATLLKSKYDCHMRCHLNNKVIKCNRCDYSTINIRHMSRHERMHMQQFNHNSSTSAFTVKAKYLKKLKVQKRKPEEEQVDIEIQEKEKNNNNVNFELIKNLINQFDKTKQNPEEDQSHSCNLITPPSTVSPLSPSTSSQKMTPPSPLPYQEPTINIPYSYPPPPPPPPPPYNPMPTSKNFYQNFYHLNQSPLFYSILSKLPADGQACFGMPFPASSECELGVCKHRMELEYLRKNVFKILTFLMPQIISMFNLDLSTLENSTQIDKLIDYLINSNTRQQVD